MIPHVLPTHGARRGRSPRRRTRSTRRRRPTRSCSAACPSSPARPSELRPDLPASFDAPLAALAKEPAERTESAEAFREALLAARGEAPQAAPPMRVVIADGDAASRSFLSDILKAALPGAQVEAVADEAAVLAAIERSPPALGVFDLDVPGLDSVDELTDALEALLASGPPRSS